MKLDDGFGFGIIRLYLTLTTGIFAHSVLLIHPVVF